MSKRKLTLLLVLCGGVALAIIEQRVHHSGRNVADTLKQAGYTQDDAGRFILDGSNGAGISLAYDPNLHDPTTGFRSCVARINACFERTSHLEPCIDQAPRCVSQTPWKNDPAGDDCCPESCVDEFHQLRKTKIEVAAFMDMVSGTCYPGMKAIFSVKTP